MLAQKTQELSDRAHAEHDLEKAAKEVGATVKTSDLVDRTAQVPDIGAMTGAASVAFTHEGGRDQRPHPGRRERNRHEDSGSPGAGSEQMKQDWDKAKETLLEQKREEYEDLYVENLRNSLEKEGKIKINKKEMDRLANAVRRSSYTASDNSWPADILLATSFQGFSQPWHISPACLLSSLSGTHAFRTLIRNSAASQFAAFARRDRRLRSGGL